MKPTERGTIRYSPLFLLLILAGSAVASPTNFSMEPGEEETFLVEGENADVTVTQGMVEIVSKLYLGGAWLVTLRCSSASPARCEGTIG